MNQKMFNDTENSRVEEDEIGVIGELK